MPHVGGEQLVLLRLGLGHEHDNWTAVRSAQPIGLDPRSSEKAFGRIREHRFGVSRPAAAFPRERDCRGTADVSILWVQPSKLAAARARQAATAALDSSVTSLAVSQGPERPSGRVVLAGGQALVRAARRSVLERAGLDVAADVADGSRAAKAAELYHARVVVVDSHVPGGCVQAVHRIAARAPGASVLVVAPHLDHAALLAAVRSGAKGFVPETLGAAGLARAVEVALRGDTVIPRAGVATLIEQLRAGGREQASVDGIQLQLTRREADVVTRLRDGLTPKQIAYELEVSAVTVRRHLSSVARKRRQARPLTLALESTS